MTSVIAAPVAGGLPGADVRVVPGALEVVEAGVEDEGVVSADEGCWLSPIVDEHPATSADAATSTAIRIPARLAGKSGTPGQARREREIFATV
jgi:hypothetical protein